jgi:tetratricopeptide (TPR) repeat protein
MMLNTPLRIAIKCAAVAALLSTSALAQAGLTQIDGTVKIKTPDGKLTPVAGALVDIYRTDIKGHWDVKTDKTGHYIRLGMSFVGDYVIIASGPGMQPTYVNGVKLSQTSTIDVLAAPGDGSKLTLEQVQAALGGKGKAAAPGGPPQAGGAPPSSQDKGKGDAADKAAKEQQAKNSELQATFDAGVKHYNAGVELKKTNNLTGALSEFEQAASIDPTKNEAFIELSHKANANAAETDYVIGVDLFNQKKREEARPYFEKAVDAISKAITVAPMDKKNTNLNNDLIVYYDILAKNTKLLVEHYGQVKRLDDFTQALDKAEELDATHKMKWENIKGDTYRAAGQTDKAVAAYKNALAIDANYPDALYGIGLTLVASTDKAQLQEAANYLADFTSKAPPNDKRVGEVKEALDALKAAFNVEAEKPKARQQHKAKP